MGQCGQNIFVSSTEVPWAFAVRVWDIEKYNFSYGGIRNNSVGLNGHYTQLVRLYGVQERFKSASWVSSDFFE